jgi:hypothetical protein
MIITFTYNGKWYTGVFSRVQGAGDTGMYHLMINKYYKGCLRVSLFDNRWIFDGEFAQLAEGFGELLHLVDWIKYELEEDEEGLFYSLIFLAILIGQLNNTMPQGLVANVHYRLRSKGVFVY